MTNSLGDIQHSMPMLRYLVHRFGNSLQSVSLALINLSETLGDDAPGDADVDRAKAHVAELRAGLWMLSDLVDLLDQPDAPPEYVRRPIALMPLLSDICGIFQIQNLPVQLVPGDDLVVLADKSRLTWVLSMLIRASLRRQRGASATPMVHVGLAHLGGRACVAIADDGPMVGLDQAWGACGPFCREVLRAGGGDITASERAPMSVQLWLPLAERS